MIDAIKSDDGHCSLQDISPLGMFDVLQEALVGGNRGKGQKRKDLNWWVWDVNGSTYICAMHQSLMDLLCHHHQSNTWIKLWCHVLFQLIESKVFQATLCPHHMVDPKSAEHNPVWGIVMQGCGTLNPFAQGTESNDR